jgi:hypothetical protein
MVSGNSCSNKGSAYRNNVDKKYNKYGKFGQGLQKLDDATTSLSSPRYREEAWQQDLNPLNLQQLHREIARAKSPKQKEPLMYELGRLEDLHRQMLEGAAASSRFPIGDSPAMAEQGPNTFNDSLIQMMRRRHGRGLQDIFRE